MRLKRYGAVVGIILFLIISGAVFLRYGTVYQLAFAGEVKGLQEIYETPIPFQIRKNFDEAIQARKRCPECVLGIVDGDKYFDIFSKGFLVVGLEPNPFGGFWAVIAIEGEPRDAFVLWLYDIGEEEYDLRSIDEFPNSLDEELICQLWSSTYHHYWL